jgi:hypothetical protein
MTTVPFDTLKFVERLRAAGVPELQAKAMAEAQIEALGEATALTLATKTDIYDIQLNPSESNTPRNRGFGGVPKGIRTPVAAVKGQCPRPLDDGDGGGSGEAGGRGAPRRSSIAGPARGMVEPGGIEPPTSTMPL